MTSTDANPYAEFRFAPDPAEREPAPGEWYRDPANPPLFCDGPEGHEGGVIAHVYDLPGDLSRYVIPKRWRYLLARVRNGYLDDFPETQGAADTAAEAMREAEAALLDYYAQHRPAEGYAALVAGARRAGFAIEEAPAFPGGAGAALAEDEARTIRVSLPDDDAPAAEARQVLADLTRIIAEDSRAAAAPDSPAPLNVGH